MGFTQPNWSKTLIKQHFCNLGFPQRYPQLKPIPNLKFQFEIRSDFIDSGGVLSRFRSPFLTRKNAFWNQLSFQATTGAR